MSIWFDQELYKEGRVGVVVSLSNAGYTGMRGAMLRAEPRIVIPDQNGNFPFRGTDVPTYAQKGSRIDNITARYLQLVTRFWEDSAVERARYQFVGDLRMVDEATGIGTPDQLSDIARGWRKIEKRMEKMIEQRGDPLTFGQNVARFTEAIDAEVVLIYAPTANGAQQKVFDKTGIAVHAIDRMIEMWFDSIGKKVEYAA